MRPWDVLEDGTYDAFVVDAATDGPALRLDLTIIAGAHKGEVVSVRTVGFGADELEVVGMPATVTVRDGQPSVAIDAV